MRLELLVNGSPVVREIEPQELLLDVLRDRLGLTGAKRSCDVQACGACTVLVDGRPVSSCCFLAADADGRAVETVEGLTERPEFDRLEAAFTKHAALQCGFCTPGMLMTGRALLDSNPDPTEDEIRTAISGAICRCTGYKNIVAAVRWAAEHEAATRQEA